MCRKTPQGYQHGEDKLFPTINQLITAYQGVLSFPWTDDDDIIKDISREAQGSSEGLPYHPVVPEC